MAVVIMALGMVSTLVFHVDHYGVALLSKVEPGLPKFIIPSVFHVDLKHAAGRGLMIAVVVMAKTIGCVLPLAAKKIRSGSGDHGGSVDLNHRRCMQSDRIFSDCLQITGYLMNLQIHSCEIEGDMKLC